MFDNKNPTIQRGLQCAAQKAHGVLSTTGTNIPTVIDNDIVFMEIVFFYIDSVVADSS